METSDSDYFESADEDFRSDDETQIEQKIQIKQATVSKIAHKTEKLSVSVDLTSNLMKKDGNVIKNTRKLLDNAETKVQDVETRFPPDKTECWEPGINYENTEKLENLKEQSKGQEFPIPSTGDIVDLSGSKTKFQISPAVSSSECSNVKSDEKKTDSSAVHMQDIISSSDIKGKPKRPEFGIPPARTTCWVPGVTNPTNMNTPFEPHPAYLELMKKRQQNVEEKSRPEFGIPPARTTCVMPGITNPKNINESIKPVNPEENMWDNEDWGDFDNISKKDNPIEKPAESKETYIDEKCKKGEENMWEDDDWEPIESRAQIQRPEKTILTEQPQEAALSWGGWSNWGLSSVLSTATTLTSQVSQGISNVLETGIGAPDPEELAKMNKLESEKVQQNIPKEEIPPEKPIMSFGLGNLVHGVTKLVETTSTKMISGGLDTLETIGKKTMEVLQENDPGLKKKRAFLKLDDDKPILSQLLREAKEKAEKENKELEKKHFARKANYETLFDDHQGLVHLEALEMLSKQCDIKLQNLLESTSGDILNEMQETLDQVKELCELPEEDEDETLARDEIKERLESAVTEINVNITYKRLLGTLEEVEDWLSKLNLKICSKNELHQQAIESLAQLTAIAVEQFHKAGELLLVKDHRSTADEADALVLLTTTLTALIGIVAAKFSEKLNMIEAEGSNKEEINSLITNVFFEAANSSSYIQDAFQLLMPVLQVGAL